MQYRCAFKILKDRTSEKFFSTLILRPFQTSQSFPTFGWGANPKKIKKFQQITSFNLDTKLFLCDKNCPSYSR